MTGSSTPDMYSASKAASSNAARRRRSMRRPVFSINSLGRSRSAHGSGETWLLLEMNEPRPVVVAITQNVVISGVRRNVGELQDLGRDDANDRVRVARTVKKFADRREVTGVEHWVPSSGLRSCGSESV